MGFTQVAALKLWVWSGSVGFSVGFSVSFSVGVCVGAAVGFSVGLSVGFSVGAVVGATVGASVAFSVGFSVCTAVGASVGAEVGALVGVVVGAVVDCEVAGCVGVLGFCSVSVVGQVAIIKTARMTITIIFNLRLIYLPRNWNVDFTYLLLTVMKELRSLAKKLKPNGLSC